MKINTLYPFKTKAPQPSEGLKPSEGLRLYLVYHHVGETLKVSPTSAFSLLLLLFSTSLFAQIPIQYPGQGGTFNQQQQQNPTSGFDSIQQDVEIDTAHIRFFYAADPAVRFAEKDSLLNNFFQQYDPTRHRQLDYFHLGLAGTAAYPSVYQPILRRGLDMGLHQFDVYQIRNADIKFYEQGKAFSDVFYSGAQQTDGLVKARFARNFANGVNFSIDYGRVYNSNIVTSPVFQRRLGQDGGASLLDAPRGRQVAFGLGLWVNRPRYDGFFTFTSNITKQYDIGGIDTASYSLNQDGSLASVEGLLDNAVTRHQKFEYSYLQYYKLRRDSTGTKRNFLASHQMTFRDATYFTNDPFLSSQASKADSLFYKNLLTDQRGMRFQLRERMIENAFSLSTSRARKNGKNTEGGILDENLSKNLFAKNDSTNRRDSLIINQLNKKTQPLTAAQNDWFEVGLVHAFHNVNQEMGGKNFNNLILRGRWNFTPNDNIKVETSAHFNLLGHNVGDYRLAGELFFNWKNVGSLTAKMTSQLYEPSLIQEEFVITQKQAWLNENLKKTLETNLSGTLAVKRIGFEATVGYSLLNNLIYFDSTHAPKQTTTPLSILQLIVSQNFRLGNFHLDNTIAFQNSTEKFIRLPSVYSKNSLYWEGKLFKKAMLSRLGVDLRYVSSWSAPYYMPFTGQFEVQENGAVPAYPALDVFASFRVQSFRIFVKYENILGNYTGNRFYQIYNYPTPETNFRFGVRWFLLN